MRYVIDYGDGSHQISVQEFASLAEAQDWQAEVFAHNGRVGTLSDFPTWLISNEGQAFALVEARSFKLNELLLEGNSRLQGDTKSIPVLGSILSTTQTLTQSPGEFDQDVYQAYTDAAATINSLPTAAAVLAYNVVTEPNWP